MVKKSKRKQIVVPFEKTAAAAVLNISTYHDIALTTQNSDDVKRVMHILVSLTECVTLANQAKILQENKGKIKTILCQPYSDDTLEKNRVIIKLLLHLLLDPDHMWLKKNLEWLTDAISRTSMVPPNTLRHIVKEICMKYLDICVNSSDMSKGSMDKCFGWVYSFQCMYLMDRDLNWLDDGSFESTGGCWESSVWPAGQDIGNGSLLKFLEAIVPLLRRCAGVIRTPPLGLSELTLDTDVRGQGEDVGQTATAVMRHAECVGECLRVVSAVLKPRRGAIIPATVDGKVDSWDEATESILQYGCEILSSESVGKDVLTSTALVMIGIQWLLRVRLWERNALAFNNKCPGQKDLIAAEDWTWKDQSPCAGLQLIALLCLIQLQFESAPSTVESSVITSEFMGSSDGDTPLAVVFAGVVGLAPVLTATLAGDGVVGSALSDLSKCALFRACMSVFDSSAVMYQPVVTTISQDDKTARIINSISFLCQVRNFVENSSGSGEFWSDTSVKILDLQLIASEAVTFISHRINSTSIAADSKTMNVPERSQASGILLGVLFDMTMITCFESTSPDVRVYGLQTMESWLGRVDSEKLTLMSANDDGTAFLGRNLRENLLSCLASVSTMLSRAWSHPSKIVNHMVPAVYQRVIDVVSNLDMAMKSRDAVGIPDYRDIWAGFLSNALAQPVEHRGRYQALSVLLPKIGGERLLQLNPNIVRSLVVSMRIRDVASSVGAFLGTLLRSILQDSIRSLRSVRIMYIREVAAALCSPDAKLRTNAADYLCPEMFDIDSDFGPLVIEEIRHHCAQDATISVEHKLWGLVSVVLHARLLTKSGGDVSSGGIVEVEGIHDAASTPVMQKYHPLTAQELKLVCLSDDVDLRLLGLTVLTASQRVLMPLQPLELGLLRSTLPYSLKSPVADVRQRVLRVLRTLVTRLRESYRSSMRDLKKAFQYRSSQNDPDFLMPDEDNALIAAVVADYSASEAEKSLTRIAVDVLGSFEWLNEAIMANFYPGAPNDREIMALEMVRCVHSGVTGNIGSGVALKNKSSHCTAPVDKYMEATLLSYFNTEQMTSSLLNLLISSWDPTRALAADLLLALPKPLPGYDTTAKVTSLWIWGCQLMGSAKQRESDSGALIVRVVMSIYCLQLKWKLVPVDGYDEALPLDSMNADSVDYFRALCLKPSKCVADPNVFEGNNEAQEFVCAVCTVLDKRLKALSAVFDALSGSQRNLVRESSGSLEDIPIDSKSDESGCAVSPRVTAMSVGTVPPMPTYLAHGGILALKYCITDLYMSGTLLPIPKSSGGKKNKSRMDKKPKETESGQTEKNTLNWRPTAKRIMELSLASLATSLQIVAESPVDNFFAPVPLEGAGKNHILQEKLTSPAAKKSNTRGYASDSFMLNTNVFMDLVESEEGERGGDDNIGVRMQRAVVGAWLLVKESCSLLAKLVEISVSMSAAGDRGDGDASASVLLTTSDISTIGFAVLDAISRLKHNGAISEAQAALQSICESILGNGSGDAALTGLPTVWLDNLIDKLRGEQQVFILRRSAGFAFSFLSLLRAEPKNCKPVMLPMAMTALFEYASKGAALVQDESQNPDDNDSWRSVVHALNIIRLIILDSTLGPDLHSYIPQATMIAVKGFTSPLWAIRNSSMMVFSAVVQRTVDNDKRESGGIRAATPSDYFQRFPSLYPFLLSELAQIVGAVLQLDPKAWPLNIMITRDLGGIASASTHPSLYPILLMLSKMRTQTLGFSGQRGGSDTEDVAMAASEACDIGLFVPLVQMCASQPLFQVRVIAAKALASLVPLQQVPHVIERILKKIVLSFQSCDGETSTPTVRQAPRCNLSSNLFHGMLLQINELMYNLRKHMSGGTAEMGSNQIFFSSIVHHVSDLIVPQLVALQQVIIAVAVQAERDHFEKQRGRQISSLLDLPFAPVILLTFERVVKLVYDVCPSHITTELLVRTCEMNIAVLIASVTEKGNPKAETDAISYAHFPFTPLLWKECLRDLVDMSFFLAMKKVVESTEKPTGKVAVDTPASTATLPPPPSSPHISTSVPLFALTRLLNHPISEVREGVMLGADQALQKIVQDSSKSSDQKREAVIRYLELTLPPGGTGDAGTDAPDFILTLLRRCLIETEPPLMELTMRLLASVTEWIPFPCVSSVLTKESCIDAISSLLNIACGLHRPDSMLDFLDPTMHSAHSHSAPMSTGDGARTAALQPPLAVISTTTAACAIQVLGWIVRSYFHDTQSLVDLVSPLTRIKSELLQRTTMGRLCREQDCCINGERRVRSNSVSVRGACGNDSEAVTAEIAECHDGHVWAWLRLMELGGVGPDSGVDIRGSVAKCLASSGALLWTAVHGAAAAPIGNPQGVMGSVNYGGCDQGGGDFGCRVWTLALKLMQDDDSDVRSWMNDGVSAAVSIMCQVEPEFLDWSKHKLSSIPCMRCPQYPPPLRNDISIGTLLPQRICCGQGDVVASAWQHLIPEGGCHRQVVETSTVQGVAMERLILPLALCIGWSILQSARVVSGHVDVEAAIRRIVNPADGETAYAADEAIPHMLSSLLSTSIASSGLYVILERWLDTCGSVEVFNSITSPCDGDVSQKIFEADQSNLFEEEMVYSRALSFSLGYNIFLLPCDWTLPIVEDFVRRAWNALSTIRKYVEQSRQMSGSSIGSDGWIGGFSYQPETFRALYNSLSGAAFLCATMRDGAFAGKKQKVILRGMQESQAEMSAAKAVCALLEALGSLARFLLRDIRGSGVAQVEDENNPEVANTDTVGVIVGDVEKDYVQFELAPLTIHPLLIAQLVDLAGPNDESKDVSGDDYQACILL